MKQVVLLACGSYNPIHIMHLRMLHLAKEQLECHSNGDVQVIGAILSPTHDKYGKRELISAHHRCQMIELAIEHAPQWICLSRWECEQSDWSPMLPILKYHRNRLQQHYGSGVELRLLCGADQLNGLCLSPDQDVERIAVDYGIVCKTRKGLDIDEVFREHDVLTRNRSRIEIAVEWSETYGLSVSSSDIRKAMRLNDSIAYLVPSGVAEYIEANRLYR